MPDNKNNKDPLEELFRKKAADYDIRYRESDWQDLEKKLDLREQQATSRRRQVWLAAASVLIFGLLSYFTFDNYIQLNELNQFLSNEPVPGVLDDDTDEATDPEIVDIPPPEAQTDDAIARGETDRDVRGLSPLSLLIGPLEGSPLYGLTQTEPAGPREPAELLDMTIAAIPGSDLHVPELSCSSCALDQWTARNISALYTLLEPTGTEVAHAAPGTLQEDQPGPEAAYHGESRFSVGLIAGPDLSSVGSVSNFTEPGYNIGVSLEYRISSNLSISTGVVQSQVRYRYSGSDYNPSLRYDNQGILPESTFADCMILDIPVNLTYNFLHFEGSRLYATAGFSSYIMLAEDYRFSYARDYPNLMQSWLERSGNNHLMSNAGFSIGYELDVMPNWSIRAEPYVKIPIREVGWSNVRLFSIGSLISLNYNL